MYTLKDYIESADYIKNIIGDVPDVCIVLGSGLGKFTEKTDVICEIPYSDIPHFKSSTALGHSGKLIYGKVQDKKVLMMSGRFHYYEGYEFSDTAFPIRVMKLLGTKNLIVTNAAGGINKNFSKGALMLICDHIKFFSDSPVRGKNIEEFGEKFFDMSNAYDKDLRATAKETAKELGITLHEGVYAYMPGPQYETPAEIRALSILGADAVGMSTVAEVITAAQCGLRTMGISCITNMASGVTDEILSGQEVVEVANMVYNEFSNLIYNIILKL